MREEALTTLAKQHIGLSDKAPDSIVPNPYLSELKKHIGLCPNDTNFRVTLTPNSGTGKITCLEEGCYGMLIPAAGEPQELNDVFHLYRRHVFQHIPHQKSRDGRIKVAQLCALDMKAEKRPVTRHGDTSLLKALDTNTPPLSRTTLTKSNPPAKVATPTTTQPAVKRVSTLTRVKLDQISSPTVAEVKAAQIQTSKPSTLPEARQTPASEIQPTPTSSSLDDLSSARLALAREQLKFARARVANNTALKAALNSKARKSALDRFKMADLDPQIAIDNDLIQQFTSVIDSIMAVDPFGSSQPVLSMDGAQASHGYDSSVQNDYANAYFQPDPMSSSLYGAVSTLPYNQHTHRAQSYDTPEVVDGVISYPSLSSTSTASSYVTAPSTVINVDDDYGTFGPFDEGRGIDLTFNHLNATTSGILQDTHVGQDVDDITKFLKMAGNSEQFDGNTTVDDALKKLGLKTQYDLLPGMAVPLMPHQTIGVAWMLGKEADKALKGGALSDDMGLGKTVQMIALMVKNRSTDPSLKTTLIIAPAALLDQWKLEIELKTNNTLSCLIYHGPSRPKRKEVLLEYDVILTTYQTMSLEWPDYEQELKKEERQRKHKRSPYPDSEDMDDGPQHPAKKRKTQQKGLLFEIEYYRVVLDEAQNIRNKRTRMSRAVTQLDATYRWCLTGTPIINSLTDVYPYLRFIRVRPWHDWSEFQARVACLEKKQPRKAAERLQAIISIFLLRRMKNSMLDGKRLIELPEKTVSLIKLEFSREEREIYKMVEIRSQAKFNRYLREGTVLKNYHQVLVLLLRLRQVCAHPSLITEDGRAYLLPEEKNADEEKGDELARACKLVSPQFVQKMQKKLKEAAQNRMKVEEESVDAGVEDDECPICFDLLTDAVVTPCTHVFCRECIMDVLNTRPVEMPDDTRCVDRERPCPSCRSPISKDKLFSRSAFEPAIEEDEAGPSMPKMTGDGNNEDFLVPDARNGEYIKQGHTELSNKGCDVVECGVKSEDTGVIFGAKSDPDTKAIKPRFLPSTKMKYMMEFLEKTFTEKQDEKVLVISQWTSCLSLVSDYLSERGISHVKYQGDMKRHERDAAVRVFMSEDKARVMLISLKCGGIGLNLTRANNVVNLDLAWSQAIESQAFDRVHRLGQTRPVTVERLVISNTVEDRVLELQERKQTLADGSLGEGSGKKMKRLTVRELANLFGLDIHGRRITDY